MNLSQEKDLLTTEYPESQQLVVWPQFWTFRFCFFDRLYGFLRNQRQLVKLRILKCTSCIF
jgi:hypothetical protein